MPDDNAAPPAAPPAIKLGKHEEKEVLGVGLIVRNTGDGLSSAMDVDPVILKHGDRVGVYIEGEVVDLHFPGVKETKGVRRLHVINADVGIVVDDREMMQEAIADMQDRKKLKDEAEVGIQRFPEIG